MRVALTTLGCRLNQFETDAMQKMLEGAGFQTVEFSEEADVYVVNTCTITHEADGDSRQMVRRAVRRNPKALVVVTGCYAQAEPERVASIPGVDLVLGNGEKASLFDYLKTLPQKGQARVAVGEFQRRQPFVTLKPATDPKRSRAYLKIQDGCNYRCAFCIVPEVRGPNRSLPVEEVLKQLDTLVEAGVPEVVLTGIHLGTYGRDLSPSTSLAKLVEAMLPRLQGARLRLSSLDPHEVRDDLMGLFQEHPEKLCRHLHLPVQSGDPKILKLMRRAHTAEDFRRLVLRLAEDVPGISIGSDIIVG
ncbi:MAG: MiaB/RimO family radical SAM methylthiotransferase, partial [candidate division NC10 bacterium]|nr:MiaB/RimO family radical SAM methylthiotransferase [candidate division NC10 bacterium]